MRFPRERTLMSRVWRGGLAVAAAAVVAGCSTAREPTITGSIPHEGYKTRHPILLTEQAETLDLPVGSQAATLTDRAAGTVTAFAEEAVESGARSVTVLLPKGSANAIAAARVSRSIAQALRRGGVSEAGIVYRGYPVADPSVDAPVRLAYPKMKAGLDHACGQWPEQITTTAKNVDYWNFGCATQANLAAMVVEPADLVTPRGATAASAARRQTIFRNYEAGKPTVSEQVLKHEGSITQLGGG